MAGVRVLVALLVLAGLGSSTAHAGPTASRCPRDASLGSAFYVRAGKTHVLSLGDCVDRLGRRPAAAPPLATVRSSGSGKRAKQTIWVRGRAIFSETQSYTRIGPGDTPGPIELLGSGDGRWIFFTIDPGGSGSIAADGLTLRVVSATGGPVHELGVTLPYPDYLAWCGGRLVYTGGGDRVAAHAKRLLVAAPPDWRPRPLWNDRARSFGSVACAPDARSVAVLSQRSSGDASFFSTRWQLWRVALDGSRTLLDGPPPGWADESPVWSPDGRSLLFVRERRGHGTLQLWRFGPLASLGYSLGYYGHHAWPIGWRR
jgi:hypothetical protein